MDTKKCPVCGEEHQNMYNFCERCTALTQYGVLFVGIDMQKTQEINEPVQTGQFLCISEFSAEFRKITQDFHPSQVAQLLETRVYFIDHNHGEKLKIFNDKLKIN